MSLGVLQHVEGAQCLHLQSEAVRRHYNPSDCWVQLIDTISHPRRLEFESSLVLKRTENLGNLGVQNLSGRVFGTM